MIVQGDQIVEISTVRNARRRKLALPIVPLVVVPVPARGELSKATVARASKRRTAETASGSLRYLQYRRFVDQVTALLLLVAFSPLLLILILAVRLFSRGPAIYKQERVGIDGRVFTMYKIRSMYRDAERNLGAVWSQPGDPRVAPFGRFLRWSHLDELPQLVNIARGEMALIGPRPERPEILQQLQRLVPGYNDRLRVLPGMTGLAQVTLPADTDSDTVRRKTTLDREYIRTAGFALDCHIVFCTIMLAFGLQRKIDSALWNSLA